MGEQEPRDYLTKVLELSQQMVHLTRLDPGHDIEGADRRVNVESHP